MSNTFQTDLLDELCIQRGLRLERERQSLLAQTIQWLNEFGDRHGIHQGYIFGSVTQPHRFHEGSDVDIAVEEVQPDDLFAVIGFLSEAIARDVDVIVLIKCHFAEQIRRSGILWIKVMDKGKLILLSVDVKAQMGEIQSIHQKIVERANKLQADDPIILKSIAYQIHNLYCATEDLLKIVAKYFENNISDLSQWHSLLLQRMATDIPGIRPAFLNSETYSLLNNLRGFRHFFRHAYGAVIEYEQLKNNLDKALRLITNLGIDLQQFMTRLSEV